jgi:hypothetical protein
MALEDGIGIVRLVLTKGGWVQARVRVTRRRRQAAGGGIDSNRTRPWADVSPRPLDSRMAANGALR